MPKHITPLPGDALEDLDERVHPLYDGTIFPKPTPEMEQSDPSVDKLCIMCDKPGNKLCADGCKTRYCSKSCEKADKDVHERICDTIAVLTMAEYKNAPDKVFALSFHRFTGSAVWEIIKKGALLRVCHKTREKYQKLDPDYEEGKHAAFEINVNACVPWRRAGHGLQYNGFMHRAYDDSEKDEGINTAIMHLSPPGTAYQLSERIEIFAYTRVYPEGKPSYIQIEDVTARDFRTAVDFFQTMRANSCIPNPERFPSAYYNCEIWPAVKINSTCEVNIFKWYHLNGDFPLPRMQQVSVPSVPLNGVTRYRAIWADLLGLSWFVQKVFAVESTKKTGQKNHDARWLVKTARMEGMEWELEDMALWAPLPDEALGTVIVSHEKGAPIHPLHIKWMSEMLQSVEEDKQGMSLQDCYETLLEIRLGEGRDDESCDCEGECNGSCADDDDLDDDDAAGDDAEESADGEGYSESQREEQSQDDDHGDQAEDPANERNGSQDDGHSDEAEDSTNEGNGSQDDGHSDETEDSANEAIGSQYDGHSDEAEDSANEGDGSQGEDSEGVVSEGKETDGQLDEQCTEDGDSDEAEDFADEMQDSDSEIGEQSMEDIIVACLAKMALRNSQGESSTSQARGHWSDDVFPEPETQFEEQTGGDECSSSSLGAEQGSGSAEGSDLEEIPYRQTLQDVFRSHWAAWIKAYGRKTGEKVSDIPCPYDFEPM